MKRLAVEYYKNHQWIGLHFKNGIDPQILIDIIRNLALQRKKTDNAKFSQF